jgi:hypothetical protein
MFKNIGSNQNSKKIHLASIRKKYNLQVIAVSKNILFLLSILQVVTAVNSVTVPSSTWKKQITKESAVATTKLFPVTSSKPSRSTEPPQTKTRGGISKESAWTVRSNKSSYLWQFPELSEDALKEEEVREIQGAVLELKKEKSS